MSNPLEPVFVALRDVLLKASSGMDVTVDEPGRVIVKTRWIDAKSNEPAWFSMVQIKKNYVSFHLMPIYSTPALADHAPPELRARMQGKSCFNFKTVDPDLFDALARLTTACAMAYAQPVAPHAG